MVARRVGEEIADDPRQPFRPLAKRLARADITVGNIGAAFWGLLAGYAICWLLERADFAADDD